MLSDGIKMYLISFIIIMISAVSLVKQFSLLDIGNILWGVFSLGYLYFWFYYGYKLRKGFLYGLKVGVIAAGIGLTLSSFSGTELIEPLQIKITTWFTPLLGVLQHIPKELYYFEIVVIISFFCSCTTNWTWK